MKDMRFLAVVNAMHAQLVVCRKAVRHEVYTLGWSDVHRLDGCAIQSADDVVVQQCRFGGGDGVLGDWG